MLRLYRMYGDAIDPLRADKAALGRLPLEAYRYCEPMRTASGYGWYVFPPIDIELRFDGLQLYLREGEGWTELHEAYSPEFIDIWNSQAPPDLHGAIPPFVRSLSSPRGALQIWSGYLAQTAAGWSLNVRGLPNQFVSHSYCVFEGIVESDVFAPVPLFINLQITSTDTPVHFSRLEPLFQIQPLERKSYAETAHELVITPGFHTDAQQSSGVMTRDEWQAFRKTVHIIGGPEPLHLGDYAVRARKRAKSSSCDAAQPRGDDDA